MFDPKEHRFDQISHDTRLEALERTKRDIVRACDHYRGRIMEYVERSNVSDDVTTTIDITMRHDFELMCDSILFEIDQEIEDVKAEAPAEAYTPGIMASAAPYVAGNADIDNDANLLDADLLDAD